MFTVSRISYLIESYRSPDVEAQIDGKGGGGGQRSSLKSCRASLVAQMVKNPPAIQETWVQSLGWEDPLEEGMATRSSIFAWRIPMDRGAWQATTHGIARSWIQLSD